MQADWTLMAQEARQAGPERLSLMLLEARNLLLARHAELLAALGDAAPALDRSTADLDVLLDELADAASVGAHSPLAKGSVWWQGHIALMADDLAAERLVIHAQRAGVLLASLGHLEPRAFAPRESVGLPPSRVRLGSEGGAAAFAPPDEMPAEWLEVPGFDIDATPVTWGQYLEFVEDGGYDELAHFSGDGRLWLNRGPIEAGAAVDEPGEARRAPRYVQQSRGAVVMQRFGRSLRVRLNEPVMHLTFWEAQAWCNWAGRRLPTEAEWVAAATQAARRGFVWGDVWEWTTSRYRLFADRTQSAALQAALTDEAAAGAEVQLEKTGIRPWAGEWRDGEALRVVKGGSFASAVRLRHPQFRGCLREDSDAPFVGFRSCSI
jgi:formylglycine-generating enzyme required for sulfatase activity